MLRAVPAQLHHMPQHRAEHRSHTDDQVPVRKDKHKINFVPHGSARHNNSSVLVCVSSTCVSIRHHANNRCPILPDSYFHLVDCQHSVNSICYLQALWALNKQRNAGTYRKAAPCIYTRFVSGLVLHHYWPVVLIMGQ